MTAYYNEFDPYAAQWLRNLISAGHIASGDVDERSIIEVSSDDLKGYTQAHFFAGIGGWSLALRLAGWPDDAPVWTGSCPCQPLSSAGQRKGHDDERHLWPAFHRLISERQPSTVFGEQVASADGREWFSAVRADLEDLDYACGAADLCAAGVGAPQIRQRLWWVAHSMRIGQSGSREMGRSSNPTANENRKIHRVVNDGSCSRLAHASLSQCETDGISRRMDEKHDPTWNNSASDRMGYTHRPSALHGQWRDADWLWCRDERWRLVEPGTFPLAHGVSNRVGRLRAYGNAIVPQVAAQFISAFMDCRP